MIQEFELTLEGALSSLVGAVFKVTFVVLRLELALFDSTSEGSLSTWRQISWKLCVYACMYVCAYVYVCVYLLC